MKLTRSNIGELPVGRHVVAFNPQDDDEPAILGTFVRTNRLHSDHQDFLFVTVQQEDGFLRVFDLDEYMAYGENEHVATNG